MLETLAGWGLPHVAALKRVAEYMKANQERLGEHVIATAIVTRSAMLRGALQFSQALATNSSPERVFETEDEARAWLASMIDT